MAREKSKKNRADTTSADRSGEVNAAGHLGAASAQSQGGEAKAVPTIPPKQAVVIIHGIGEQRPMETLRSFVRAVWRTDPDIKETAGVMPEAAERSRPSRPGAEPAQDSFAHEDDGDRLVPTVVGQTVNGSKLRRAWMVPDARTGSNELARMTTAMTEDGYRVDFFELYWADIMQGTTWSHLKAWIFGLLLRWPHQVPRDVVVLWIWLWIIAAILVAIGLTVAPELASMLGFGNVLKDVQLLPDWLSNFFDLTSREFIPTVLHMPFLWAICLAILAWSVRQCVQISNMARRQKIWNERSIVMSGLAAILIGVVLIWLISRYFELLFDMTLRAILSSLAFILIFLINAFLVPYFGDVARYVQAAPENIAQRAAVRERGVKLLRALHDVDESGEPIKDRKPNYGRIILVGHSLGSIIAYDILLEFWARTGPLRNPIKGAVAACVDDLNAFLASDPDGHAGTDWQSQYRAKQKALMKAMREAGEPFRITDFVTVGSPLTHSEFLVSHDLLEFKRLIDNRLVSLCPPFPYENGNERIAYEAKTDAGKKVRHILHAASFAAVRWTNIFDKRRFVLFGDLISGPLRENFGAGVADRCVKIRKPGLLKRFFTHTHYWNTASSGEEVALDGSQQKGDRLTHIGVLRRAIAFNEYHSFYPDKAMQRRETHSKMAQAASDKTAA